MVIDEAAGRQNPAQGRFLALPLRPVGASKKSILPPWLAANLEVMQRDTEAPLTWAVAPWMAPNFAQWRGA